MQNKNKKTTPKGAEASRTRNFATVVYPESAPLNWQQILEETFIPSLISPLHDKDLNPDGNIKKPHYHVFIMFDGVKTNEQAVAIFDLIGGVGQERISSPRGYARYLCHLDNPEKHQYEQTQVRMLSGADYYKLIGLASDKYTAISEMIQFSEDYDIHSYAQLLKYCSKERYDWFRVLCDSGTVVMKEFLKSRTWTQKILDDETGEIKTYLFTK